MILWPALNLNSDHVWRQEQTCLQLWAWNLLWHKAALMTNDLFAPNLGGSRSIFAIYLHWEMTALLCCSTEALRENLLIQGRLLNWNFTQVLQEQQALHNGANIFIKSEFDIYTPVECRVLRQFLPFILDLIESLRYFSWNRRSIKLRCGFKMVLTALWTCKTSLVLCMFSALYFKV